MDVGGLSKIELLIASARGGDDKALGRLLECYRNYLMLLVQARLGRRLQNKFDPTDVVQETFLRASAGFETFRGDSEAALVAWLRRILASRLYDLLNRFYGADCRDVAHEGELQKELDNSSEVAEAFMAPGSSPSHTASRRERAVIVSDSLAALPEHYRRVIVLHHFEQLALPAVAQEMGRSVDSVEKLWVRALARLRRTLAASTDA